MNSWRNSMEPKVGLHLSSQLAADITGPCYRFPPSSSLFLSYPSPFLRQTHLFLLLYASSITQWGTAGCVLIPTAPHNIRVPSQHHTLLPVCVARKNKYAQGIAIYKAGHQHLFAGRCRPFNEGCINNAQRTVPATRLTSHRVVYIFVEWQIPTLL